jgi:class 3 adenylate cyclase
MAVLLAGCTQRSTKAAPRVVDGVLDVSTWDFENDGPVKLEGDWEVIPEGLLEGEAVRTAPPSGDFVSIPWHEAHHRTRNGGDIDASRWVQLLVRIVGPTPERGFVVSVADGMAEAFHLECRSRGGAVSLARGGIASPAQATSFPSGLWPHADVDVTGAARCAVTLPRGVLDRIPFLEAPLLDRSALVPRRRVLASVILVGNVAMVMTFLAFAGTMVATQRRDPVAKWSLALAVLYLVRITTVNRGELFGLGAGGAVDTFPWWRLEYADLWLLCVGVLRYGQAITGTRLRGSGVLSALLIAYAVLPWVASYSVNRAALPGAQVLMLVVFAKVLIGLARAEATPAVVLSRVGFVVALVGSFGSIVTIFATGKKSVPFEALASTEPFFQMAVLAVRAQEARKKSADLARATQHFVPRQFLHELGHADVTTAKLGDAASRHVTVLFADIRDFTTISERMSPAETFAFLNTCLSRIGPHVRANGGFVDKYIGDAIMALFPGHPSDAIRAAMAMQAEVEASNARHPQRPPLAIGVGVHVGDVMMGTIGEAERFEATVISDTVNLTARLESLTKQLGCSVLLSGDVFAALDESLREHTRKLGSFVVKGRAQAVELYELFASDSPELRAAKVTSMGRFDELLAAYAQGDTFRALDLATELRDACPDDGPATWWFLRLAKECADDAIPSSNGLVVLDAK